MPQALTKPDLTGRPPYICRALAGLACAAALLVGCGSNDPASLEQAAAIADANACLGGPTSAPINYFKENPRTSSGDSALPFNSTLTVGQTLGASLGGLDGSCLLQNDLFSLTTDTFYPTRIVRPDGRALRYAPTDPEFQQLNSFYYTTQLVALLTSLGVDLGPLARVKIDAHCNVTNNAYFSPSEKLLCLGYVNVGSFRRVWAADDADIVTHESGHGVNHALASTSILNSSNEAGAIDESIADYWALTIQDEPRMGEWFLGAAEAYIPTNGLIRDATGPQTYPTNQDYEVHDDSRVLTQTLWALRGSLGRADVDAIVALTLTLLPATTRFADFYLAFYDAAQIHYGVSTSADPRLAEIRSAFAAKGLARNDDATGLAAATATAGPLIYVIDDHAYAAQSGGNCNGTLDVGEAALLLVNLKNPNASEMGAGVAHLTTSSPGVTIPSGWDSAEYFRMSAGARFVASLPPIVGGTRRDATVMASFLVLPTTAGSKTFTISYQPMFADPLSAPNPSQTVTFTLTVGTTATSAACANSGLWP